MSRYGYSGRDYDRYAAANGEQSTITKMKETYWTTKQAVMTKLGKKQDEYIVASDSELDAKLEFFRAIQRSTIELLHVIERYQDRLCLLSREENTMGRMLKTDSVHDKTRAGKMMAAVGKAQCYSSQQMLNLRAPLVRLYQEVETFRYRAISDTLMTVNRMEGARTEYRGALMWMKDVSEVLDPDTSKQLQKFRAVQQQVKKSKAKFDKLKLDSMQKIDLLAASRCNMFSHVLARYQTTLLEFWSKTSTRMTAVAQSFKGYQYFEFNMLKELGEPSKKLADETGASNEDHIDEDDEDGESAGNSLSTKPSNTQSDRLTNNSTSTDSTKQLQEGRSVKTSPLTKRRDPGSLNNLLDDLDREFPFEEVDSRQSRNDTTGGVASPTLLDFDDDEDMDLEEIKRKQDEEFGLTGALGNMGQCKAARGVAKSSADIDLLSDEVTDFGREEKDLTLLNEILNSSTPAGPAGGNDNDFEQEWTSVFGGVGGASTLSPEHSSTADFMPSCLLDMTSGGDDPPPPPGYNSAVQGLMGLGMAEPIAPGHALEQLGNTSQKNKEPAQSLPKKKKQEMSAWFNLFAELDPLANPDAIGRTKDDLTDA